MRIATLSLAVTAAYLLIVVYELDVARALGPAYVAAVLVIFWLGHREGRRARS